MRPAERSRGMVERSATCKRVKFGDVAQCVTDRVDDPKSSGVERYVGLEHLDSESLAIRRWGAPDDVASTKLRFKPGDIIFGKRRAYQRKLAVADFEGICSAHAMVLRAKPTAVLPEFLPFLMQSEPFMRRAVAISVGSLSPTINWKTLATEEFVLPSLEDQRRLCPALLAHEAVRQASQDLARTVEVAFDSYAAAVFRGHGYGEMTPHEHLGLVAANFKVLRVGELVETSQYGLSAAPQEVGAYPILRMMNLVDGHVVENDLRYVDLRPAEFETYRLESGDVLFNRTNSIDLVGRTGVYDLDSEHVFASYLVRLKVRRELLRSEYLSAYLNAPIGRQQVLGFATKAVSQANVSASNLAKVLVPVPSLETQDQIVAGLNLLRAVAHGARLRVDSIKKASKALMSDFYAAGSAA